MNGDGRVGRGGGVMICYVWMRGAAGALGSRLE